MRLFAIIFGGVGLLLLAIAAVLVLQEQGFLASAQTARGTVTNLGFTPDPEGGGSYCPKVEFTAQDGRRVNYQSDICSDPPAYQVGEQVSLLYDPQNPQQVQMPGLWGQYGAAIVLLLVGLPFTLIGVWSFFSVRRRM